MADDKPVSTEQDSVRRLAQIRARVAVLSPRTFVDVSAAFTEDVPYLLSLIDSLTAERDNAVWRADRLDEAGRVQQARAEAAEAEVKRLREALVGVVHAPFAVGKQIAREALATPPSEGGAFVMADKKEQGCAEQTKRGRCGADLVWVDYGNAEIFQCVNGHRQPKDVNR